MTSKYSDIREVSFVRHLEIIRALVLRELRFRYSRRPLGVIEEFFRPTLIAAVHVLVFSEMEKGHPPGVSMFEFVWGGFTIWFICSQTLYGIAHLHFRHPNIGGITLMHLRIAIVTWILFSNILFCIVSVEVISMFSDAIHFPSILKSVPVLFVASFLGFGWGLLTNALTRRFPFMGPFLHFSPWFVFLTSGIYFSSAMMPSISAAVVLWNPVLHLIELQRNAFTNSYPITYVNLYYPFLCATLLFTAALLLDRTYKEKRA